MPFPPANIDDGLLRAAITCATHAPQEALIALAPHLQRTDWFQGQSLSFLLKARAETPHDQGAAILFSSISLATHLRFAVIGFLAGYWYREDTLRREGEPRHGLSAEGWPYGFDIRTGGAVE
jgi:hypothetical protein